MTSTVATDRNVSAVVRMLLEARSLSRDDLVNGTGISRPTLNRRLATSHSWTAMEVALLASYFDVPVQMFYEGPGALWAGTERDGRFTWTLSSERRSRSAAAWPHRERRVFALAS